jgi:DNA repair photolyase
MLAPVIPALTDHELESLLEAAVSSGARRAAFLMLRLPFEVAGLFEDWLREHYPDRADKVLNLIRGMRSGRLNDPRFGHRMQAEGAYAATVAARFAVASRRLGLDREDPAFELDTGQFRGGEAVPHQQEMFDGGR